MWGEVCGRRGPSLCSTCQLMVLGFVRRVTASLVCVSLLACCPLVTTAVFALPPLAVASEHCLLPPAADNTRYGEETAISAVLDANDLPNTFSLCLGDGPATGGVVRW